MENRLCLNSVPTFELPEGIRIEGCRRSEKIFPSGKPDIRVCVYGCPFMEVLELKEKSKEAWIYLEDKSQVEPIKQWISSINWLERLFGGESAAERTGTPGFPIWRLKKIITEEFYNV